MSAAGKLRVTLFAVFLLGSREADAQRRDTTRLDTVAVTATRPSISPRIREFEERRARWVGGVFITRAEIEKRHATRVTDLFLRLTSVRVIDSSGVKLLASTRGLKVSLVPPRNSGRLGVGGNQGGVVDCILRTGVDGLVMGWGFDLNLLVPEDIEGIEIFPGASSIPSQYTGMGMDKGCGLVMIWTRTGERE